MKHFLVLSLLMISNSVSAADGMTREEKEMKLKKLRELITAYPSTVLEQELKELEAKPVIEKKEVIAVQEVKAAVKEPLAAVKKTEAPKKQKRKAASVMDIPADTPMPSLNKAPSAMVTIDRTRPLKEQYKEILSKIESEQKIQLDQIEAGKEDSQTRKKLLYLQLEKTKLEKDLTESEATVSSDKKDNSPSLFSYRGHFQYRMEGARNTKGTAGATQNEQSFYRLRSYFTFRPNENLEFNITPQATKGFGANNASGATTSGSSVHTELFFYEANFAYKLLPNLSMKLGRQEIAYGEHLVIGSAPWDNNGKSFDALRFNFKHEKGWSELFYSKTDNNSTPTIATDDVNLAVLYNSWDFGPQLKSFDFYLINQEDFRKNAPEVNMAGLRVRGDYGKLFYRMESGAQSGRNLGGDAWQTLWEAGTNIWGNKVSFEFASAGTNYRILYPTSHRFLGFADVLGRRNLDAYALHLSMPMTSWFTLNVDQHFFQRHNTSKTAYKINGSTAWGTTGSSKDIGREIDVVGNFKSKDGITLQLGAAIFTPGDYLKDQPANNGRETRFIYAQILAEF